MPFDRDENSIDRFSRLSMVAAGLTGDLLPAEILDMVISQGAAGLGADHAIAALVQGGSLHPIAALGVGRELSHRFGTIPLRTRTPIAMAAATGAAVFVPSRRHLEVEFAWLVQFVPPHLEAVASMPLLASGRAFGAIGLLFNEAHTFGPDERDFLTALADMAALALRPWAAQPPPAVTPDEGLLPPSIGSVVAAELEAAVAVDADGRITQANQRLCQLLGYPPDALVGQPIETLLPERHRADHIGHVRRYLTQPTPRPYGSGLELTARRADGSVIAVDVALSPVVGPHGVLVVAVVRVPLNGRGPAG